MFKTWEPNETGLNMLKGYRFVIVGEKGLEIPAGVSGPRQARRRRIRSVHRERGCCALVEDLLRKGISGGEEWKGGSRSGWGCD
ncbi:hypothetical protein BC826DRAFT_1000752 [Russula brevipes]|nr:hypothetical protein BC826DRAFT_1000752 [Russula brevipes]